ncbi:MAG: methylmalonyl Co-A mutase-associated GTPase MeaB [Thermoflexales bacterium]|nr:methylmalonyl Co-A mutase-associated GTPase MeaB [Thermoflexales bacterium]MCS7324798.1 methylmalonyl Co-A mutase-associated GTPase MeaB [Thermoflexales bacterium]MDW8053122.1 methylmalonyl Co-A mutase-associated GTPase MeaB [Anaerolineae bacterium]MDW8291775.1 methylmalonyl Co-A mutase-associated GTPase MeaB [Anaerolineae bacterium]
MSEQLSWRAPRALARLLTAIENGAPEALAQVQTLYRQTAHRAHIVGITGVPGGGKSTLVAALTRALREQSRTVAVLSVDPSSPFTRGAILGDRIRMRGISGDPGVFIRSLASRSAPGGIAAATADMVTALDAAGFDVIFVETVGAGQDDVAIARLAETVVVVEAPGLGDDIQAIKAGLIEIADILVVNKADLPDAQRTAQNLAAALALGFETQGHHGPSLASSPQAGAPSGRAGWRVPVLLTSAAHDQGVAALIDALQQHRAWLETSEEGKHRRLRQAEAEIRARLYAQLMRAALAHIEHGALERWAAQCAQHRAHPEEAARALLQAILPKLCSSST